MSFQLCGDPCIDSLCHHLFTSIHPEVLPGVNKGEVEELLRLITGEDGAAVAIDRQRVVMDIMEGALSRATRQCARERDGGIRISTLLEQSWFWGGVQVDERVVSGLINAFLDEDLEYKRILLESSKARILMNSDGKWTLAPVSSEFSLRLLNDPLAAHLVRRQAFESNTIIASLGCDSSMTRRGCTPPDQKVLDFKTTCTRNHFFTSEVNNVRRAVVARMQAEFAGAQNVSTLEGARVVIDSERSADESDSGMSLVFMRFTDLEAGEVTDGGRHVFDLGDLMRKGVHVFGAAGDLVVAASIDIDRLAEFDTRCVKTVNIIPADGDEIYLINTSPKIKSGKRNYSPPSPMWKTRGCRGRKSRKCRSGSPS